MCEKIVLCRHHNRNARLYFSLPQCYLSNSNTGDIGYLITRTTWYVSYFYSKIPNTLLLHTVDLSNSA